jgi:hypothetical protein
MAERNSSPARNAAGGEARRATSQQRSEESASSQPNASETRSTGMVDRMKDRVSAQINSQKDRATDGLGTMAQAVRQSTQQLRDQQHDTVAGYVEQAAEQIEKLSQTLKQKNVGELLSDAQRLARRQPALFVGAAFTLGLIGARVMKSSPPDEQYGGYRAGGASLSQYSGSSPGGVEYQRTVPATTSAASGSSTAAGTSSVGRSPSPSQAYRSNTENR